MSDTKPNYAEGASRIDLTFNMFYLVIHVTKYQYIKKIKIYIYFIFVILL
jgi:hypothetical protein